jgi:hypothetical protein
VRSEDTTRRRRQAFVLVAAVSLALLPSRAWAGPPDRVPFGAGDQVFHAACPFPVFVHVVTNNQYTIEFSDRTIIQGHAVLELTNMDNPEISVIRNVSGPGTITHADGVLVATGPWFFPFEPGELVDRPGGTMFINKGRIVMRLGDLPRTPYDILSQIGVEEDLCATLGASPDAAASRADAGGCPDGEASEPEASETQVRPQGPTDARPEGADFPDELGPGSPGSLLVSRERNGEFLGEPPEGPSRISQTGVQEDPCPTLGASPDGEATEAAGDETEIPLGRLP